MCWMEKKELTIRSSLKKSRPEKAAVGRLACLRKRYFTESGLSMWPEKFMAMLPAKPKAKSIAGIVPAGKTV